MGQWTTVIMSSHGYGYGIRSPATTIEWFYSSRLPELW